MEHYFSFTIISTIFSLLCVNAQTQNPISTTTPRITDDCIPGELFYLPHPYLCNKYILCFDGTPVIESCAPDFAWSVEQEVCLPAELANCREPNGCPAVDDLDNIVYLPHADDCQK